MLKDIINKPFSIRALIEKGLKMSLYYAPEREKYCFHISEFGCPRAMALSFLGFEKKIDLKTLLIFDTGKAIHELIQRYLTLCGIIRFKKEVRVKDKTGLIRGTCDGVFRFNGVDYVLEIKTMKRGGKGGFENLSSPLEHHVQQINAYMACLNLRMGIILYVCKDNSHLKDFQIEYNEEIWNEMRDKAYRIYSDLKRGILPVVKKSFSCISCFYKDCKDVKINEQLRDNLQIFDRFNFGPKKTRLTLKRKK